MLRNFLWTFWKSTLQGVGEEKKGGARGAPPLRYSVLEAEERAVGGVNHRGKRIGGLHQIDALSAVALVDVALGGVGNDVAVLCLQAPAILATGVAIDDKVHDVDLLGKTPPLRHEWHSTVSTFGVGFALCDPAPWSSGNIASGTRRAGSCNFLTRLCFLADAEWHQGSLYAGCLARSSTTDSVQPPLTIPPQIATNRLESPG